MSAREVMVRAAYGLDVLSLHGCKQHVEHTISALTAAGYVILSPDEVRGIRDEALEDAIKAALDHPGQQFTNHRGHVDWAPSSKYDVATAIRSLKGGRDAQ